MRLQIWIIGGAFVLFGVVAWIVLQKFSPVWIGLILTGVICFALGWNSEK